MLVSRDGNAEASTSRQRIVPNHDNATDVGGSSRLADQEKSRSTADKPPNRLRAFGYPSITRNQHYRATPTRHSVTQPSDPASTLSILSLYPIHSPASAPHIRIPPQLHSMVSGACAGLVASIVTCPLDVLKTSLQASSVAAGSAEYEGVQKTAGRIWRQAGLRGFYRGLGPTLAGYLPTWGIYFTVYDLIKDRMGIWASDPANPHVDTSVQHIIAAMTAGATGTIFTNPIWVVKTRFMAQATMASTETRYRSTLEAFSTIYKTEGFKTFYKGLLPSLFGVVHVAVQFPLYEKAKTWADTRSAHDIENNASLSASTILGCSAFSKMIASVITYPHEVLRTRLQVHKSDARSSASSSKTAASALSAANANAHVAGKLTPGHPHFYSPLVTGSHPPLPLAAPTPLLQIPAPEVSAQLAKQGVVSMWRRPGGIVETFLEIKRQDGWKGFYRGLSINLVRTVPNSAVTMLTYELIMRSLARR